MREWFDIVAGYRSLCGAGKPSALATVVCVDGSAYRRPGARMLIAEDGRTWGGVSGGCLERDVAERARGVIAGGRAFLQRYDTTDEQLIERGVSTGCGGTIDVLIQPLDASRPGPIDVIAATLTDRRPRVLATIVRATGGWRDLAGVSFDATTLLVSGAGDRSQAALSPEIATFRVDPTAAVELCRASEAAHSNIEQDIVRSASLHDADMPGVVRHANASFFAALTAAAPGDRDASTYSKSVIDLDASADVFFARVLPPQRLVIVGGGPDAVPVVAIAKTLGWHVAVVAARPALLLEARFAAADERYVTSSDAPLEGVPIGPTDAVVVMTHNLARDAAVMAALGVRPRYLGLLGPRHRTARVTAALPAAHPGYDPISPVGLNIGSETPEEIALSIVAEIQACVRRVEVPAVRQGAACGV